MLLKNIKISHECLGQKQILCRPAQPFVLCKEGSLALWAGASSPGREACAASTAAAHRWETILQGSLLFLCIL